MKNSRLPVVGIAGSFQSGKSTLVNCLLKRDAAVSGCFPAPLWPWCDTWCSYGERARFFACAECSERELSPKEYLIMSLRGRFNDPYARFFRIELPAEILKSLILVDAAGFADGENNRENVAWRLEKFDFVLLVLKNTVFGTERAILDALQRKSVPFAVINNVADCAGNDPFGADNLAAQKNITGIVGRYAPCLIGNEPVLNVNALWQWYVIALNSPLFGCAGEDFSGIDFDPAKLPLSELERRGNVAPLAVFLTAVLLSLLHSSLPDNYRRMQK